MAKGKLSEKTLKSYLKSIYWMKGKTAPFAQGTAINYLKKHYKIPTIRTGYGKGNNIIALETSKQYLMWRDKGYNLEFLGIVNKG